MPASCIYDSLLRAGGADAERAKAEILEALQRTNGVLSDTAEELNVSRRTLHRLLAAANLNEEGAKLRIAAGIAHWRDLHLIEAQRVERRARRGSHGKRSKAK